MIALLVVQRFESLYKIIYLHPTSLLSQIDTNLEIAIFFSWWIRPTYMGRRARNKQAAPEPLEPKIWSAKKPSGKRKADTDRDVDGKDAVGGRPVKKARKSDTRVGGKAKTSKAERNGASVNQEFSAVSSQRKGKKNADDAFDGEDSADGWEDIEDGTDLKAQTK